MSRHSLRLRLLFVSIISITTALILAGIVLVKLFERYDNRRIDAELATHIRQLAGHIRFSDDGRLRLSIKPADPRFNEPLSGLYWQLQDDASGNSLRSRSLWDYVLPLPVAEPETGDSRIQRLAGPGESWLITQERAIVYGTAAGSRTIRIAVAIDVKSVEQAASAFAADVRLALLTLALFLIAVAALQIVFGLRPLEAVRRGVRQIRSGDGSRLNGTFPDEVMPLVSEVNALLDSQDRTIERAHHQAANLAHALKTPLTVIMSDAQKLKQQGQTEIADELADLSRQMHQHIDRELARTRTANQATRRDRSTADIARVTNSVIEILRKTPQGGTLVWRMEGPSECRVNVDIHDVSDLVGNILDNAAKWARTCVSVTLSRDADEVIFKVDDDGPGVAADQLEGLRQRGIRLDQQMPGSGIGLAIVDDIVSAYTGKLVLGCSEQGGFSVTVHLPAINPADD